MDNNNNIIFNFSEPSTIQKAETFAIRPSYDDDGMVSKTLKSMTENLNSPLRNSISNYFSTKVNKNLVAIKSIATDAVNSIPTPYSWISTRLIDSMIVVCLLSVIYYYYSRNSIDGAICMSLVTIVAVLLIYKSNMANTIKRMK